ncbi:MAG: iron hydrogenase [Candidatus Magasanikbacteria bacterium]|nr:iron hydrogenase [Candidatus Magasanikbacteria bacterium]
MPMSEQVEAVPKEKTIYVVGVFLFLLGGVMLAPLFPNQFISGPIVNAILLIVTVILGLRSGILMSFLPSVMALVGGLLPAIFIPFIPFIMAGNIIFVTIFHYLRQKNFWLGAGAGSVVKFIFLYISSKIMFDYFTGQTLAGAFALMMSWNQLYSAAVGSLIAFLFLKTIKRI